MVEACAGSGKTWLLVSRMIRLLLAGAEPSELLAITFTFARRRRRCGSAWTPGLPTWPCWRTPRRWTSWSSAAWTRPRRGPACRRRGAAGEGAQPPGPVP
ncbi:MAG: UvrD-helicase domain-containing protein [Rhodocyclaceae bacterium]|nr:UvrD-helicase domain-containing protein [Rhodocyclaceae bacterium]